MFHPLHPRPPWLRYTRTHTPIHPRGHCSWVQLPALKRLTPRRHRHARLIRHRRNIPTRCRGLRIRHHPPTPIPLLRIHPREVLVVPKAGLEDVRGGVVRGVVGASDAVVGVLAEVGGVGAGGVAGFDAKCAVAHEAVVLLVGEGVKGKRGAYLCHWITCW